MATLKDVARKAGVSMTTVSRVLNKKTPLIAVSEKTREKVLSAARELKYQLNILARSLRTKQSGIIGVVIASISTSYFSEMLDEVERILNEQKYHFFLSSVQNNPNKEEHFLGLLQSRHMDGLLFLVGGMPLTAVMSQAMKESQVPIVLVGREFSGPNVAWVSTDNFRGEFIATEHLIDHGHRSILYMTREDYAIDAQQRLEGYRSAMKKHDIEDEIWVVTGGCTAEAGYCATIDILEQSRVPTAILAFNDECAFGVIRALTVHNRRVSDDVAVVGYDNLPLSKYFTPPLSSISQSKRRMSRLGVEMLIGMIGDNQQKNQKNVLLESELIIRESSSSS